MGNLLTDSPSVELSLWADTVYNIQVTCRNKVSRFYHCKFLNLISNFFV